MRTSFSLINKTRGGIPRVPFEKIKNDILGRNYDLSAAFITRAQARAVTRRTKHKDKASNVLSFPLSPHSGEILICPAVARAQAPQYKKTYRAFLAELFIHGLLHLKGMRHGATMEHRERKIAAKFRI
ncbi:MAG: rRNA maturation RNase YbeY [Patescibacteria group bacterium]|nr:rRNA maturation RNase YbeY [Patescibacteria group bacterium]